MTEQKSTEHQHADTIETEVLEIQEAEAVTPHNRAIYEVGKAMLVDSLKIGRDFCQFMITLNTGAISVYLALLTFLLPKNYSLSFLDRALDTVPALLFLLSALIFAIGFFPVINSFALITPLSIEQARRSIIQRRNKFAIIGFSIFITAAVGAVIIVIVNVGNK